MPQKEPKVKWRSNPLVCFLTWVDAHPRTGWYISLMLTLNFILNLLDALDADPLWFVR